MPIADFMIADEAIKPGQHKTVDINLSMLSTHTPAYLTVHAMHGRTAGPVVFISAAIHGDEVIGVEIIRRLIKKLEKRRIKGTLLFIPIVNAYGFINYSRYLPDRRDLNRCFPGSKNGSLAGRLAQTFMSEIVEKSDFGIDLHSAAIHRTNLPQIRADLTKSKIKDFACIFGAPAVLHSDLRDGSLRQAAQDINCDMLLYEAGEALRLDEYSVRVGYQGVLNVLHELNMISGKKYKSHGNPVISKSSKWLRAPDGGLMRAHKGLADAVEKDEVIGYVSDPMGASDIPIIAQEPGIVIGRTNLPVVNQGDALFHIASFSDVDKAHDHIEQHEEEISDDDVFDEQEIV